MAENNASFKIVYTVINDQGREVFRADHQHLAARWISDKFASLKPGSTASEYHIRQVWTMNSAHDLLARLTPTALAEVIASLEMADNLDAAERQVVTDATNLMVAIVGEKEARDLINAAGGAGELAPPPYPPSSDNQEEAANGESS